MRILKVLYKTNKTLANRIRRSEWLYIIWITGACLFLAGFGCSFNLVNISGQETRIIFSLYAFLFVMIDVLAILLKFQEKAMIESKHVRVFPISRWKLYKFYFLLLAIDMKSFILATVIIVSSLFLALKSHYIASLVSPIFWILLWINLIGITLIIYRIAGKWLNRYRKKIINIGLVFICVLLASVLSDSEIIFTRLPIISFVGNGLFGLLVSDQWIVLKNILYLLASCLCMLLLLKCSSSNY